MGVNFLGHQLHVQYGVITMRTVSSRLVHVANCLYCLSSCLRSMSDMQQS